MHEQAGMHIQLAGTPLSRAYTVRTSWSVGMMRPSVGDLALSAGDAVKVFCVW